MKHNTWNKIWRFGPFGIIVLFFGYVLYLGLCADPSESTHQDQEVKYASDYNLLMWKDNIDTKIISIADKNCLPYVSLALVQSNATLVIYKGDTCLLGARHSFDGVETIKTYMFDINLSDAIYGRDSADIILIPVRNVYKDIEPLRLSELRFSPGEYSFSAIEKNDDRTAWIHRIVTGEVRRSYKMNLSTKGDPDFGWMYKSKDIIYIMIDDYLAAEICGSSGAALLNEDNEVIGVAVVLSSEKYERFVSVRALP